MIQVEHVYKELRSGRGTVQALADVSFSVRRGEFLAIAGKSGSGKTTLLNVLGGLEQPDSGTVNCFGVKIEELSGKGLSRFLRENVGFVFQHGNLLSCLTVYENIGFPLNLNGVEAGERDRRIAGLLEDIGLSGAGRALPSELSGGELQRVAVARALAHRPRVLLADEPTASLDSATGRALVDLMFRLGKEQGCTLVVSTHDPEILELAEASLHIKDGKIVEHFQY
jgi:putative ABC transport system ATP-binding protein